MTATLGETYAAPHAEATAEAAAPQQSSDLAPRRARRDLTARIAHSPGRHRVVTAMLGTLGFVVLAGALLQAVAG
ncbi:MAG: hypothetical protein U5L06_01575 [Rhodovibrio sp.]|nr:hypothetical protein [Rhodovibrio sp.]